MIKIGIVRSLFVSLLLVAMNANIVHSANTFSTGISQTYFIDEPVESGDIIEVVDKKYLKSSKPYSSAVAGIVVEKPAVVFTAEEDTETPLLSSGVALVKVTSANGTISQGDYITTSSIPGVAMKATEAGFVLGVAQTDYSESNSDAIGLIPVSLQFKYIHLGGAETDGASYKRSLMDIFTLNRLAATESPGMIFKYTIAAVLLVASFIFGFYVFGRTANRGIEAVGRNPMAGKLIGLSVALNVLITVVIILAGVVLSYLIIVM